MQAPAPEGTTGVVIAGGGVAGLETLLALADLAADRVEVTLVAPEDEFLYKPLTVEEPFRPDPAERHDLAAIVAQAGARFVRASVVRVDPEAHEVELDTGGPLTFDRAAICIGAKPRAAFARAATMRPAGSPIDIDSLLRQAAEHEFGRFAFIVPPEGSWPLPIYELALMSRRRAAELGLDVEIVIVTPEPAPLFAFGKLASDAVAALLESRGITVRVGARARENEKGEIHLEPWHEHLDAGAVVALPVLDGPAVPGLPADDRGFIPIDEHARISGLDDVYAAGDGTNFPVKHGGLGTQQADAAAEQIAASAGAAIEPRLFHPVLRGRLITGDESLNLEADIGGGGGEGVSSLDYLWWPPDKVAGKYLSAQLRGGAPHPSGPPPEHGIDVEVSLERDWHGQPLGWGDGGGSPSG
jgi:sulfide:quinone oxidoreductase